MFQVGDAVVHPIRGAGIVTDIEELERRDGSQSYYRIELMSHPRTSVMVPVNSARDHGLRAATAVSRMGRIWHLLDTPPRSLPGDYSARHELLRDKLHSGEAGQVAEVLRDLAWRRKQKGHLTVVEKRLYREGVGLLAGEVAAIRQINLMDAKLQIWNKVRDGLPRH
jgi:RNA polymerase-interacting CarD/CdnL/TRCF family regulator